MDIEGIKRPAAAGNRGKVASHRPRAVFGTGTVHRPVQKKVTPPRPARPSIAAVDSTAVPVEPPTPPATVPSVPEPQASPTPPVTPTNKRPWWRWGRKDNGGKNNDSKDKGSKAPARTRRQKVRRVVWVSLAAITVLVLGVGGFLSWRAYANLHKVFRGTSAATVLSKTVVPDDLKTEGDGRINILLMGIGGPGHQGSDLTDTIVVFSIDPVNNSATMLSVPRDLWVKMPVVYFGKEQKINAAYSSGKYHITRSVDVTNENVEAVEAGFDSIDQTIRTVFNLKIDYHVLVNFKAFKQAVDAVGGITVNVPTALYDPTMAWENHDNPVLAPAGVQEMNGSKALLYARSRETTSDFARNERQRQILLALKDKVLTLGTLGNPAKIDALMQAFGNNVYADLSTQEAMKLYDTMNKISDDNILSVGLTDEPHKLVTTDRVNSTSVVRPIAGFFEYAAIEQYVRSELPDGYIVKEKAPITIAAPTEQTATAAADLLKSYGYKVTGTVVATQPVTAVSLIDLSRGSAPYTLHYLKARFSAKPAGQLPDGVIIQPGSAKFVILVPNEAVDQ